MPEAGYENKHVPLKAASQSQTEGRNVLGALTEPDAPAYSALTHMLPLASTPSLRSPLTLQGLVGLSSPPMGSKLSSSSTTCNFLWLSLPVYASTSSLSCPFARQTFP